VNVLKLTAGDTKPTGCYYTKPITGYGIKIQIGYPTPLEKAAVITSAAQGKFEFQWAAQDLQIGEWPAKLVITDAAGKLETTQEFTLSIEGRIL
jgi:hypothetical protein